ncbi:class I SAM-dependent methyltransferase [Prosthecomicrobium hirschii]|uniref:class I SAM-dependent methyltransferase n=1 Tax=Prosthecodimorpha hirschii TaxID=665126 RepID=UPI001FCCDF63|nr:rRNA adenine N-6-methyltransferase family protein [Prosthecomicrobium hirschii]MCW1841645.1 methyltransferase domain-containing protein [Prosthecomicrobium hirschii]
MLDEVRFLKSWLDKPLQVGAVAPSGPALAKAMARFVDPALAGSVVELGPGTGVVTKALVERGVTPDRIVSIEYDGEFCKLLRNRFPGIQFIHGDAYQMRQAVEGLAETPLSAVVSSLPLFTRPLPQRLKLLDDCLSLLAPGAPFIQFSYALVPPVPPGAGNFVIERTNWVVMNLPPARVWVYRRPA